MRLSRAVDLLLRSNRRYRLRDPFSRADSNSTLGNADLGGAYTAIASTFGVISGQAYSVSDASGNMATVDPGRVNMAVEVTMTGEYVTPNYRMPMLMLMYVDGSNHLESFIQDGQVRLQSAVGGVFTVVASANVNVPNGTPYRLRVTVVSGAVFVHLNGAGVISYTLSGAEQTAFGAGTKVGMRLFKFGSPTLPARWDDLVAWDA